MTTTTTPCPEPMPSPECNGVLIPVHHPETHCLVGYRCVEETTTTTPTPKTVGCAPESKNCFRSEQRSRRVRSVPQDSPFIDFIPASTTTPPDPPSPIIVQPPNYLLDLVIIPDSGSYIACPAIEDYVPPMYFTAEGGDEKIFNQQANRIIHNYYSDGLFVIYPYDDNIFEYADLEILLVGGGGGGGSFDGGGGGGGGQAKKISIQAPKGVHTIDIGIGGTIGFNGSPTEITSLGLKSEGGGAGGSAFTDNAQIGANGGGAGGRSNSAGAIGIGGNSGGSSVGNYGGGGGGGAGQAGRSSPNDIDGVLQSAGKGGDGVSFTLDGINSKYYAGGGAGDDFGGLILERSLGGGGGTLDKNGVDGTGGGGAGGGGVGGKGFCAISYTPLTTPPPTTTTTRPPSPPDLFSYFSGEGIFEGVKILWLDPIDAGTSEIISYTFRVFDISEQIGSIEISSDSVTTENIDGIEYKTTVLSSLPSIEKEYSLVGFATNSEGDGPLATSTFSTVTTTTSTSTTIPPDFVSFTLDFDGDITAGFIGSDQVVVSGPENLVRNTLVQVIASGGYVFYEDPLVSVFGDGAAYVRETEISKTISPDKTYIDIVVPVLMPNIQEQKSLIYISSEAVEPTTTTTTTSTTTLKPLCLSIYESSPDFYLNEEGVYEQPDVEQRLLNPLQFFVSKSPFPYEIAGTISEDTQIIGYPWYNGKYFEQSRSESSTQDYIDSLPEDYNSALLVSTNPDGSQNIMNLENYFIAYPPVQNRQISYRLEKILSLDPDNLFHTIKVNILVDYICSLENIQPHGQGDESISGFVSITLTEDVDGTSNTMYSDVINNFNFRKLGSYISNFTGQTYHFLLDFGTRNSIVG